MQAIVYTRYGPPDVLKLDTIAKPLPEDNQVLVRVVAASANAADWHYMRGSPLFARLVFGLLRPKNPRLGLDFAGEVEAVGGDVTEFAVGDAVFGSGVPGAFAEYVCVPPKAIVHKPADISFAEGASVGVAGLTALQGLRDAGQLQAGQRVLINGASGGVGTFAVQIARALGATVTGVCSTAKVEQTRSLGADEVIDYTQEDFTTRGPQYDLIFDVAASHTIPEYARALAPQGRYVMAGFSSLSHLLFQVMLLGRLRSRAGGQQFGTMPTAQVKKDDLETLRTMLQAGQVKPVIEHHYPLHQTAEAIRYLEEGHVRGKLVIDVASPRGG